MGRKCFPFSCSWTRPNLSKPAPALPLRLRLALDLLQEHPLPVIDLPRLWFLLRIRLVPLAAPCLPMLRPVLPLPRRALQTFRRITVVPHLGIFLRGQDYGIAFLRSSKADQRNEEKYAK